MAFLSQLGLMFGYISSDFDESVEALHYVIEASSAHNEHFLAARDANLSGIERRVREVLDGKCVRYDRYVASAHQ